MPKPAESDFWRVYGLRRHDTSGKTEWWWAIGSNIPMGPYPDKAAAFLGLMEKVNDMQRQIADAMYSVMTEGTGR
jgi:hypothetical protein